MLVSLMVVPILLVHNSKHEQTSSYSLAASPIQLVPQLDHEDLDRLMKYDLEEMDLKMASGNDLHKNEGTHSEDDENFAFMASNNSGSDTQKLLAKLKKEKDDLEAIVDKWNHSSKNLGKIINYHMSAYDKFGLGYGDYRYSGNLSYENEVSQSVFKSNKSDFENPPFA
ncbi:hypothetical protein Tco_1033919 [Tanacetum coccineum]